jgi:hypothetical protein
MSGISYEPLIRDMTWSYSRVKAFEDCPYRWYLKYIRFPGEQGKPMFFSSYGSFMHELLESFNKGEKTAAQLQMQYLKSFPLRVGAPAPNIKVFKNYFADGAEYLSTMQLPQHRALLVEAKIDFSIHDIPFVGYVDLLEQTEDSSLLLVDNKSRVLKPRSRRAKPTKADMELDEYLKQLYLYSVSIKQSFGKFPDKLCFNCFRKGVFIEEPFVEAAYDRAIDWVLEKIEAIAVEADFRPDIEWFKCRYLCEMQDHCEYFQLSKG